MLTRECDCDKCRAYNSNNTRKRENTIKRPQHLKDDDSEKLISMRVDRLLRNKTHPIPATTSSFDPIAFIVATDPHYEIKLMNGAALPFSEGTSSTDNKSGILVNESGDTFTFELDGMYRFVFEAVVVHMDGTGTLMLDNKEEAEHSSFKMISLSNIGSNHSSTILPITPGTKLSVRQHGKTEITLAPNAKLQIYRVG